MAASGASRPRPVTRRASPPAAGDWMPPIVVQVAVAVSTADPPAREIEREAAEVFAMKPNRSKEDCDGTFRKTA